MCPSLGARAMLLVVVWCVDHSSYPPSSPCHRASKFRRKFVTTTTQQSYAGYRPASIRAFSVLSCTLRVYFDSLDHIPPPCLSGGREICLVSRTCSKATFL